MTVLLGRHRHGTLEDRFWRSVKKADGCWLWTASVNTWGYGQIRDENGRYTTAHRISWRLSHRREIPRGKEVCHHCDNTRCVRPRHLFLGTQRRNMQDKVEKSRQARGETHGMARLTEAQVQEIRLAPRGNRRVGSVAAELSKRFGVTVSAIRDVRAGKSWSHITGGVA